MRSSDAHAARAHSPMAQDVADRGEREHCRSRGRSTIAVPGSRPPRRCASIRARSPLRSRCVILVLRYPTAIVRRGAALGRRADLLSRRVRRARRRWHGRTRAICTSRPGWSRSVAAAIPPALGSRWSMNGVTILATAGVAAFIASGRLRTAVPDRTPPARAGDRLRPDAGGAGPVMAPRLPPVDAWPSSCSPACSPTSRARAGSGPIASRSPIASLTGPVLDPVRAAVRVATPATRARSAWIVVGCAAIQLVVVVTARRAGAAGETTFTRGGWRSWPPGSLAEPLLGYRVTLRRSARPGFR